MSEMPHVHVLYLFLQECQISYIQIEYVSWLEESKNSETAPVPTRMSLQWKWVADYLKAIQIFLSYRMISFIISMYWKGCHVPL